MLTLIAEQKDGLGHLPRGHGDGRQDVHQRHYNDREGLAEAVCAGILSGQVVIQRSDVVLSGENFDPEPELSSGMSYYQSCCAHTVPLSYAAS